VKRVDRVQDLLRVNLKYFSTDEIAQGQVAEHINQSLQQNVITSADLQRTILFDCLGEGHGPREIHLLKNSLANEPWADRRRFTYLVNVNDEFDPNDHVLKWTWYMTNHCQWLDNLGMLDLQWTPSIKTNLMLCLARRLSPQRSRMIAWVRDTHPTALISYGSYLDHSPWDPILNMRVPILLDGPIDDQKQHQAPDPRFFSCLLNIIPETSTQVDPGWNSIFVTEKTFKCFAWHQIPIWWTVPGFVDTVRNLGFDVFDDLLDQHSYDKEPDNDKRFERIKNLVNSTVQKIHAQGLQSFCDALWPRLQRNWQVLQSLNATRLTHWSTILTNARKS